MVLAGLGVLLIAIATIGGPEDHVLAVPYRNQLDGSPYARSNCGPAALAMALAYFDVDVSLWDLRVKAMQAQRSWVDDEGGYSHRYGVFVYVLASVAESMGFETVGLWHTEGRRVERMRQWQPADLRQQVNVGRPVIVQVEYRALPGNAGSSFAEDHYIVVHGQRNDDFVYSDPLGIDAGGPNRVIAESDLRRAMRRASSPDAAFALRRRP